jgi:hypothetical protein
MSEDETLHHPEIESKNFEKDIEEKPTEWKCCQYTCERALTVFICKFCFSMILVLFCVSQLSKGNLETEKFTLYISILTGTVNLWMPNPTITNTK